MQESNLVIALDKFKKDYSWDKSLNKTSQPSSLAAPPSLVFPNEDSAIEQFLKQSRE